MPKPLAGIRVIELANFIAGPLAGTLLADMGADVIKVEPPQGDMGRATPPIRNGESVSFVALNRNKRSLVLDLKRPEAVAVMLALATKSDVFLEAYRPGALDKLGLGAGDVKGVQPRIVYTSVSGFGQTGPDRRRAGVNLIIEAFSGALSVTGEPGKMPMRPGVQTAEVFGALFATYATLAGLVGAARNGEGRIADVSLVEASIAAAAWEAAEYLETGQVPQPLGNRTPQRAVSAVRDQRPPLSRDRHAQRPAVRATDAGAPPRGPSERCALLLLRQAQSQRGRAAGAGRARGARAHPGNWSRRCARPACRARG
jgi:crotonobetainyl-CoA:carnitine CoA-transferase CaiB-like acyl-CoA transferase